MYKNILIAVDSSETSKRALHEAIELTKALQGKLCIIHIENETLSNWTGVPIDVAEYNESLQESCKGILSETKAQALESGIEVECHLINATNCNLGIPECILDYANTWKADLIVIGTHGRSGLSRFLLGSVAEELIRVSSIPVLLVRGLEENG